MDITQHPKPAWLVADVRYLGKQGHHDLWVGVDTDDEDVVAVVTSDKATAFERGAVLDNDKFDTVEFRMAWQAASRAGWFTQD